MKIAASIVFLLYITLLQLCKSNAMVRTLPSPGVGSALAVAGTNTYQVVILQRLSFNFDVIDGKKFVCSGTLISNQWVLTAAQCISDTPLRLVLGVENVRKYEKHYVTFNIYRDNVTLHPQFNQDTLENDVALIRLPAPVRFNQHIRAIALDATGGNHINRTVFLSGWGRLSPFTPVADYLRQTTLKVISNEACQRTMLRPFFYIRCAQMCTAGGLLFSEIGSCAGDLGAPLVAFNPERGRPEVVGVVSRPPFNCKGEQPTIYSRVRSYLNWIIDVVGHLAQSSEELSEESSEESSEKSGEDSSDESGEESGEGSSEESGEDHSDESGEGSEEGSSEESGEDNSDEASEEERKPRRRLERPKMAVLQKRKHHNLNNKLIESEAESAIEAPTETQSQEGDAGEEGNEIESGDEGETAGEPGEEDGGTATGDSGEDIVDNEDETGNGIAGEEEGEGDGEGDGEDAGEYEGKQAESAESEANQNPTDSREIDHALYVS